MALIDKEARLIEDRWQTADPAEDPVFAPWHIVPLAALLARGSDAPLPRPLGIAIPADATASQIVPFLDRVDLVAVPFGSFRDGRGFTLGRGLREKHRFGGEIRATGHVIPDQLPLLAACGFTSIVTPPEHPPSQWGVAKPAGGQLLQRLVAR